MTCNFPAKVNVDQTTTTTVRGRPHTLIAACLTASSFFVLCDKNPDSAASPFVHDSTDAVYGFAAENLDTFFIYRDRMPSNLFSFKTPEELYMSVKDEDTGFFNKEKARLILSQQDTVRKGVGIVVDSAVNGYLILEVLAGFRASSPD